METDNHKYFILLQTVIYLGFLAGDLFAYNTNLIKYAGIVLCFIRAVYRRNRIIALAFGLTLVSDFFLLLLDDYYTVGVCFFISVQLTYLYYLYLHRCRPFLLPRGLGLVLGMILLVISGQVSALNVAVLIYFSSLLFNALSSFTNTELKIMSLGFVLFICCDICVGLNYILPAGNFYQIVTFGMWFFYLPSQVLICLGSEKLLPE